LALRWTGRQFHNQPEASHQHGFLVDLWHEVSTCTHGRVQITVHPKNGGEPGSDPRVLDMIVSGELEFATMMGPLIANRVPAAEVQGVPFAFADSAQVHRTLDGPLGDYLRSEMAAHGIYALPCGTLENGFRQICSVSRTVLGVDDLAGYRMRVPAGRVFTELFAELGAEPVVVNIDGLFDALEKGRVDGHENPLAITEVNELYKVTRHVALSNHVWSGFNLIANLKFWNTLPADAQAAIHAAVRTHVARQRASTVTLNRALETTLARRGMRVDTVDRAAFRARLGANFYRKLRARCGDQAWLLLENSVGKLPG
jgi:tripartite ATP-independent transporter DctP family solute receptor